MAFAFFRKRQKLIFLIMVLLMISFLIGFQGFSMLFSHKPGQMPLGETTYGRVTDGMLKQSRSDLELLGSMLGALGRGSEQVQAYQSLMMQDGQEESAAMAYTLLGQQASEEGFAPTEAEVTALIERFKNNGLDYDRLARNLRQNRSIPEKALRGVLARWLAVFESYRARNILMPPSRKELAGLYRDLHQQLAVQAVKIPAALFTDEVGEPTAEQLRQQFETYRNRLAGDFAGIDAFPFGYLRPARVELGWLFVNYNAIERGTVPTATQMREYYNNNRDALVRSEPLATQPTTDAAQPTRQVPMSFEEARAEIIRKLRPQLAQAAFAGVVENLQLKLRRRLLAGPADTQPSADALEAVLGEVTLPAEELLSRKIPLLALEQVTLRDAVDVIARQASPALNQICFPWDVPGEFTVSPDVKVTLIARDITVGEALAKLLKDNLPDMPALKWAAFEGMDGVLFPVEGVRLFPVSLGTASGLTRNDVENHPLLKNTFYRTPEGPKSIADLAFEAQPIVPNASLKPGDLGPVLFLWSEELNGQLLWRLLDARAPQSPETLTAGLREQVARDWKLARAFDKARQAAEIIKTSEAMAAFAKKHELEPLDSGLFSRQMQFMGRLQPGRVSKLGFDSMAVDLFFIAEAMDALVPKDLSKDYPRESETVMSLALPCEAMVVLARRTDFKPALQSNFRADIPNLIGQQSWRQYSQAVMEWFNPKNVRERTGFTPQTP